MNDLKRYKESYIEKLPSDEFGKRIKKLQPAHWAYSSINRNSILDTLGYYFLPDPVNTIVISYKIQNTTKAKSECTYCIAYANQRGKKDMSDENPAVSPNFYIAGICPSGSIISKDGEYRSNVIDWYTLNHYMEKDTKIRAFWNEISKYLIQRLKERKYLLAVDYYFPNDALKNNYFFEIELFASDQKVDFFTVAWFNFFFSRINSLKAKSTNKVLEELLMQYKAEDEHFLQYLTKNTPTKQIQLFRYLTNNNISNTREPDIMMKNKLGQKFYPLNLLEIQNPFDVTYRPWKEMLVSQKVTSLVVNNVTPGFAISGPWVLIANSSERLFDNPDQALKITNSTNAMRIIQVLRQAQIHTYHSMKGDKAMLAPPPLALSSSHGKSTSWVSNDFKRIYEKIQDPIDFSKEFLIMSDITLCLFSEYVGKTIYDALYVTQASSYYKNLLQPIFSEKGAIFFKTFMFELCYNLYVLHSRAGVIHGDLHLSNITLNSIFYHNKTLSFEHPKIAYHLGDEVYILEHNYYNLCLIDFSRSILDNDRIANLSNPTIPSIFKYHNIKHLEETQIHALHDYLIGIKPEYKEQSNYILNTIKYNYGAMFKVLSVLDLYNVSQKLLDFFSSNSDRHISASLSGMVKKMFAVADKLLTSQMDIILNNKSFDELLSSEWPVRTAIRSLFMDKAYTQASDVNKVIAVYHYNQPETASMQRESSFPDLIRTPNKFSFRDNKAWMATKKFWDKKKKTRKAFEDGMTEHYKVIEQIRNFKSQSFS